MPGQPWPPPQGGAYLPPPSGPPPKRRWYFGLIVAVVVVVLGGAIAAVVTKRVEGQGSGSEVTVGQGPALTTGAKAVAIPETGGNPLMGDQSLGLDRASCTVPGQPTDAASAQAFFTSARECLDKAWAPVLTARNLPFKSPDLAITQTLDEANQKCMQGAATDPRARSDILAFYCPLNGTTIYLPLDKLTAGYTSVGKALSVFAHEYGHHVQQLSGILDAANVLMQVELLPPSITDTPAIIAGRYEPSRRLELQAQCFSGLFMGSARGQGSVTEDEFQLAKASEESTGDAPGEALPDHGNYQDNGLWWNRGADTDKIAQCNTWTASPADVA